MNKTWTAFWRRWVIGQRWVVRRLGAIRRQWRVVAGLAGLLLALMIILALWWSREPAPVILSDQVAARAQTGEHDPVPGYALASSLETVMLELVSKPGGLMSNDRLPPGVLLDNMPNWEQGVLWHSRELITLLRRDMTRENPQASEDPGLVIAEPQFHFARDRWLLPSSENEYRRGIDHLGSFIDRLGKGQATFYVNEDDLVQLLTVVLARMDTLDAALVSGVEKRVYENTALSAYLQERLERPETLSRWQVDDAVYQARGYGWALLHTLQGVAVDYDTVLSAEQQSLLAEAVLELAALQRSIRSPVIFNVDGFGVLTNHALIASGHLGRAQRALDKVLAGLQQGRG